MYNRKLNRLWIAILALSLAALACQGGGGGPQPVDVQPTPTTTTTQPTNTGQGASRSTLVHATVQIYGAEENNGDLFPIYVGSGTIISPTGMILTNAHVGKPSTQGDPDPDALIIGLVQSEDAPPVYSYLAEVLAADGYLDLAVLQIASTLDGAAVNPNDLNLPFVPLGNSDDVHVGDHINILGFPLIGGDTITYTDGNVSGFSAEDQIGDRAWIKTDATISGGNSGGLAANDDGFIIGVPTIASSGAANVEMTDCRVVQDTNGDGVLTNEDTCIPIGGFINALRPVNLALPLINAARSGIAYNSPYGGPAASSSGSGQETFGPVSWFETERDCTTGDRVSSYPSGIPAVTAAFDFSGMTDGQGWGSIWYVDGEVVYQSNENWDGGADGNYSYCLYTSEGTLPDGQYLVEFYAGDGSSPLTTGQVVVGTGGTVQPTPAASNTVTLYGVVYDADTNALLAGAEVYVLKPGVTFEEWESANYRDEDIYAFTKSDANGNYSITGLERNKSYVIVVYLKGYKITIYEETVFTDQDPAQFNGDLWLGK